MKKLGALIIFVGGAAGAVHLPTGNYSHVEAYGDYLLAFTPGLDNGFVMINREGDVLFDGAESGLGYATYVNGAVSPDGPRLALLVADNVRSFVAVLGPGDERVEFKYDRDCGPPLWDRDGNFWFAAEGQLYRNGEPVGVEVASEHVSLSPDGRFAAFTDEHGGALYRVDLENGAREVLSSERKFYAPIYASRGYVVAGCAEGEIWLFDSHGGGRMISDGRHPAWCETTESVLFIRVGPEADGEYIPESEIWLYELAGNLLQITDTPDVAETWPVSWRGDIVAVDNETYDLIYIEQEW
jgi:hypothetical protein